MCILRTYFCWIWKENVFFSLSLRMTPLDDVEFILFFSQTFSIFIIVAGKINKHTFVNSIQLYTIVVITLTLLSYILTRKFPWKFPNFSSISSFYFYFTFLFLYKIALNNLCAFCNLHLRCLRFLTFFFCFVLFWDLFCVIRISFKLFEIRLFYFLIL